MTYYYYFLASADPTCLVTEKLESNLQELISSDDRFTPIVRMPLVRVYPRCRSSAGGGGGDEAVK